MTTTNRIPARIAAALCALLFALTLALACVPAAFADEGDLDEISRYDLTVTPQDDGTLAITAAVDWKVLDSTSEGPLSWVQIGIPNEKATDVKALTGTISQIETDGTYLRITFDREYQAGETVHFSYSWVQGYLYTLGSDGSVSYDYTPGWFDSANVDEMSITWMTTSVAPTHAAATGAASFTEPASGTAGSYVASQADMAHGQQMSVQFTYPRWPGALSADSSAEAYTGETYNGGSYDTEDDSDAGIGAAVFFLIFWAIVLLVILRSATSYSGGFYPTYVYVGGLYYPKGPDGRPRPGSQGVHTPPPSARAGGFGGMGGGSSFGGGAGRGGGGCACASSCACACACAGGGRAGCSAKNLYGAIHLPSAAQGPARR